MYRQSARRVHQPTHWLRYGPTYLTIAAALLVMADNTRHVLQDSKVWPSGPWPGSSQYRSDCLTRNWKAPATPCTNSSECGIFPCENGLFAEGQGKPCYECYRGDGLCSAGALESIACLSAIGWIFTVGMTYTGFLIFFFASFWNANLVGKLMAIRAKWRALRQEEARAKEHKGAVEEDEEDEEAPA